SRALEFAAKSQNQPPLLLAPIRRLRGWLWQPRLRRDCQTVIEFLQNSLILKAKSAHQLIGLSAPLRFLPFQLQSLPIFWNGPIFTRFSVACQIINGVLSFFYFVVESRTTSLGSNRNSLPLNSFASSVSARSSAALCAIASFSGSIEVSDTLLKAEM
ncbi:MAG: hypothetical protein RIQ31_41, partial [Actinomycetota bacterium]